MDCGDARCDVSLFRTLLASYVGLLSTKVVSHGFLGIIRCNMYVGTDVAVYLLT